MVKPPKPETNPGGGATSFNFEAADVRDIAKTVLADILGESYIVDPKVAGTISLRTTRPLQRDAILPTLESVLRMNGIIMIKENGVFKIMPAASAKGSLSPKMAGKEPGFTVQVVPLKYIGSHEMAKILEAFSPDPASIKADEVRNLLIVAGTQNEMQHMLDTVEMFDVDWLSGMSVGLFTLQNADVKAVDAEFNKIFGDKSLNPLAGVVRIIPLERLNGFVIISPQPHYLEQAKIWLERLDQAGGAGGTRLFVYHVQNGKAEVLADLLNQTFGKSGQATPRSPAASLAPGSTGMEIKSTTFGATTPKPATTSTPAAGSTLSISDESGSSEVRIVADKENNALLILANAAGYDKIEAALRKLDLAPRQVLIEVMIAEVTLGDEFKYGIEWALSSGTRKTFQLNTQDTGAIGPVQPGFVYTLLNPLGGIKAILNMNGSDSKINVLSSPHIMVADNQTAKIQVGDSLPIQQQTLSTTGTFSSTSYLDTGVMLSVTPRINAGGLVNLDITQEYSVPGVTTSTSSTNPPPISKRSSKTQVTVQSGETMVIGGMISEKSTNSSSGLPILSSIPVLGGLFGFTDRATTKTELIVLITPRVAKNVGQATQISDELRRKMGNVRDLVDCGTYNLAGMSSRGGLWCLQARRYDGATDKMMKEDENGISVYLKDEAKLEQDAAQRTLDEAKRAQEAAQQRLTEASRRVKETHPTEPPKPPVQSTQPAQQAK
jgi:general secretion pathway protein D